MTTSTSLRVRVQDSSSSTLTDGEGQLESTHASGRSSSEQIARVIYYTKALYVLSSQLDGTKASLARRLPHSHISPREREREREQRRGGSKGAAAKLWMRQAGSTPSHLSLESRGGQRGPSVYRFSRA
ncbi:hypothetical protein EYF80_008027 [Liparis tanakae]|uniref:Uncharacterized protein n=1 Tax=Liparis tanakae TaxID=230148 RepID=A0A4Z2IUT0_9TELE|nr:hypothetical protein EYF80_008027 [Liparis tanakae]